MRSVMFDQFGEPDQLRVRNVIKPRPGPDEVRVKVRFAGLNPVDYKIIDRSAPMFDITLPCGVGNDFAGVVDEVGENVEGFEPGDEVFGDARHRALSEWVIAEPQELVHKPSDLPSEVAAALPIVGRTAWLAATTLDARPADTVFVSSAAGGVGILAAQLVRRSGATVVGTASARTHALLSSFGVTGVDYGDGVVERLRSAAPQGYTASLDTHGRESVDQALTLGIPKERIVSVATYGDDAKDIVTVRGFTAGPEALIVMSDLLARGEIVMPISRVFPLSQAGDAYALLKAGQAHGKLVIKVENS